MDRFTPEDLGKKGFVPDGKGGWKKATGREAELIGIKILPTIDDIQKTALQIANIKPNKIRNAVKSEVNGVKFDSNLEKYMHGLLSAAGIPFDFQVEYVLQEKFRYNGEAVRAITLTVDFVLRTRNMIIDTKGFANDITPVKYKMLKAYFVEGRYGETWTPTIEMPSNRKECDLLLNRLLYSQP